MARRCDICKSAVDSSLDICRDSGDGVNRNIGLSLRWRAAIASVVLVGAGLPGIALWEPAASGDTAPAAGTPATVSADPLPTVQVDGVVWSVATAGNTVYATGSFTQTWPAGKTNTPANDTPRANLLAFDITTGNLITSFNHKLNAQGLAVAVSPDGKRVYVGGQFTTVDGQARNRIAAFDTATGALVSTFKPSITNTVRSITATNTTVYAGGNFTSAGGLSRVRLAAFTASTGAVTSWAPKADSTVQAIVLTPDQSKVVVGGHLATLNTTAVRGLGMVSATTGATLPFPANNTIRDYGPNAAFLSLSADATQVYATGYDFGAGNQGNFEGTAAINPNTGGINWVDDCHGDTYGTFAVGQVLYSVSHAHDCSAIHQFPDTTNPRVAHRALAQTTYPTGTNVNVDSYGWTYQGVPDSTLLHWYPTLINGSFTGQGQAAWAVTGNANYVVLGGEFPYANAVAQHGLVRYAVKAVAPNKVGPLKNLTALTPQLTSTSTGTARLNWKTTWDYDNQLLTYRVYRDGGSTPIYTTSTNSNFWQLPSLTFTDTGLAAHSTHSYVVRAYDPSGNNTSGNSASITVR